MNKKKALGAVINLGGGTAGAVIGSLASPLGALAGAIIGTTAEVAFVAIGSEIKDRVLSKSEEKRIGTVYHLASEKLNQRLDSGDRLRTDDFFTGSEDDRPAGEEILEGILLSSQKEYEEKKLPYIANLYANLCFDRNINRQLANMLLKLSSEITYRQLTILSAIQFFQTDEERRAHLRKEAYATLNGYRITGIAIETYDLYRRSLIQSPTAILDAGSINPANLQLGGLGQVIYELMELNSVPKDELFLEVVRFLTGKLPADKEEMLKSGELPLQWDNFVSIEPSATGDNTLAFHNPGGEISAKVETVTRQQVENIAERKANETLEANSASDEEVTEMLDSIFRTGDPS